MSDKFGFPSKKKTMIARRFADGGDLLAATKASLARKQAGIKDEPFHPLKEAWESVKKSTRDLVTPNVVKTMDSYNERQKRVLDTAGDDVQAPVEGKKRGGIVKSKPRGVGAALRGHGKVGRK